LRKLINSVLDSDNDDSDFSENESWVWRKL
jgi:hypothetical protein